MSEYSIVDVQQTYRETFLQLVARAIRLNSFYDFRGTHSLALAEVTCVEFQMKHNLREEE